MTLPARGRAGCGTFKTRAEHLKRGWAVKVLGSLLPTEHKAKAWPTHLRHVPCTVPLTCFPHHMQPRGRPVTRPSSNSPLHCRSSHPTKRCHVSLSDVNHYCRISATLFKVFILGPLCPPKRMWRFPTTYRKVMWKFVSHKPLENYLLPQPITLIHFNRATSYSSKFVR